VSTHSLHSFFVPRSAPRSVEQRRREIVAATLPLFEEEGFLVSTRRIADAAGIAEGTIFRVFANKDELMRAALASYLDPSDLIAQIDAIQPGLGLDDKVTTVVAIVQKSAQRLHTFMMAMRGRQLAGVFPGRMAPDAPGLPGTPGTRGLPDAPGLTTTPDCDDPATAPHPPFLTQARALSGAIERLLAPHSAEIATDLPTAAAYVFATGIASMIVTTTAGPASGRDFVSLTLRAIKHQGSPQHHNPPPQTVSAPGHKEGN